MAEMPVSKLISHNRHKKVTHLQSVCLVYKLAIVLDREDVPVNRLRFELLRRFLNKFDLFTMQLTYFRNFQRNRCIFNGTQSAETYA